MCASALSPQPITHAERVAIYDRQKIAPNSEISVQEHRSILGDDHPGPTTTPSDPKHTVMIPAPFNCQYVRHLRTQSHRLAEHPPGGHVTVT